METTKDLFKTLDQAEKFFEDGSIKKAQKIIRDVSEFVSIISGVSFTMYMMLASP